MRFGDAIESGLTNYVNFSGRSSRSAFWSWVLFSALLGFTAWALDAFLFPGSGIASFIAFVVLFLPSSAYIVRRMHDSNRSGWWYWLVLMPFLAVGVVYVYSAIPVRSAHRGDVAILFLPLVGTLALILYLAEPGTPGPNRYGPQPAAD